MIWEHSLADWKWEVGVGLMDADHGVRVSTPMMLAAAQADPAHEGHIVNTASMLGYVVEAVRDGRLYIYSHPKVLASVQVRLEDVVQARNPTDAFEDSPDIGSKLREALRG